MDISTIIITSVITLLVTVIAGLIVEYFKKIKPKLEYYITEAIPIEINGNKVGANAFYIENPSSRPVKDLIIKIKAANASIRNGGVKCTVGLEYNLKEEGDAVHISIPFLKFRDYLSFTSVVEGRFIPKIPEVSIRSPDNYKLINAADISSNRFSMSRFVPAFVASLVVAISLGFAGSSILGVRGEQGTNLELAASLVGLPELAKTYMSNSGIMYVNQGAYVYTLAKSTNSIEDRRKLKLFLIQVMKIADHMASESEAELCFFVGKISLLLVEDADAESWFKKSQEKSKSEFQFLQSIFHDEQTLIVQSKKSANLTR